MYTFISINEWLWIYLNTFLLFIDHFAYTIMYDYVPETVCRANNWYTTYTTYNRKILLHKYTECTQTSFYKSECEK